MKQNGVFCLPGPALLFFLFRFEYLISDPKSYRDFGETGHRGYKRKFTEGTSFRRNDFWDCLCGQALLL